jgi:hypothetical protein
VDGPVAGVVDGPVAGVVDGPVAGVVDGPVGPVGLPEGPNGPVGVSNGADGFSSVIGSTGTWAFSGLPAFWILRRASDSNCSPARRDKRHELCPYGAAICDILISYLSPVGLDAFNLIPVGW